MPTFLRTLDETLCNGIGWSRSPMTMKPVSVPRADLVQGAWFTVKGGLDHRGTFCNVLIHDKLFIIGGDEKNHCGFGWK